MSKGEKLECGCSDTLNNLSSSESMVYFMEKMLKISCSKLGMGLFFALMLSGCGGGEATTGLDIPSTAYTPNTVTGYAIRSSSPVGIGSTSNLSLVATLYDGTSAVQSTVTWASSNSTIATISSTGVVAGVAAGTTIITASINGMVRSTYNVTVASAVLTGIGVTTTSTSILVGNSASFVATGTYSDGTTAIVTNQVAWSSSNTAVVTINATSGVATGVATGSASITASMGGITSSAVSLSVGTISSISITPTSNSAPQGQSVAFTATGSYSNGATGNISGAVTWTSSATNISSVSSAGVATTVLAGSTTIRASMNGINSNTAVLTVTAPITNTGAGPKTGVTWAYVTPGGTPWAAVTDATVPNAGTVYKAATILDSGSTKASISINLAAASTVSFYYKVSSEATYDLLIFTIDGVQPTGAQWSGTVAWTLASYPISAGNHTLTWQYMKDSTVAAGSDTAWLSQVQY